MPSGWGGLLVNQLRPGASFLTSSQALFSLDSSHKGQGDACMMGYVKGWRKGPQPQVLSSCRPHIKRAWQCSKCVGWVVKVSAETRSPHCIQTPRKESRLCISEVLCCLLFTSRPSSLPHSLPLATRPLSSGGRTSGEAKHLFSVQLSCDFFEQPCVEG